MSDKPTHTQGEVSLTYKFLLTFSTLSAVFFCWLYVTKPTHIVSSNVTENTPAPSTSENVEEDTSSKPSNFVNLQQSSLPGDGPSELPPTETNASQKGAPIPLATTDSTEGLVGFEETNHKVQHVLTAKSNSSSERIILQVPVIYKTRGLRFSPEQTKEAQRVLRALKIYQSQIQKLHQDGQNIQLAWNNLLMSAQPIDALRADSPSLPSNAPSHPNILSENSSQTIKITN
ncbi:hypothetical protein [Rubritalea tangerina]|uniref:Uncharacterized protein n=1 Tax=Rubritalea tangerina TaxID=430798 RepID=A0ABW4Z784_9BACT